MKLFNVTYENGKFEFKRECDQNMKPEQKYSLLMSVVWAIPICVVVLGFFSLFH